MSDTKSKYYIVGTKMYASLVFIPFYSRHKLSIKGSNITFSKTEKTDLISVGHDSTPTFGLIGGTCHKLYLL